MILDFNRDWLLVKSNGDNRPVTIPHDAMLEEKRYAGCRNAVQSGYFAGGIYRYKKQFNISDKDFGKRIELVFEGVYRNAEIIVNGVTVCKHSYGYSEFTADISSNVKVGENTVEVVADNSLVPNCRWYSGSGIYRPVWLKITTPDSPKTLKVTTLSYAPAVIEVQADSDSEVEIYYGNTLVANGGSGKFEIPNAQLWSAERPNLYRAVAKRGGEQIETTFGIRKLEWNADHGLTVNGERVLLRGGCIHHDNGLLGACTYPDAEERRVRILKESGFNALRMAHNSASRALLDACDKLGMYVLDEAFDGWYIPKDYHDYSRDFYEGYKADLAAMVEKDFNHPSVIMYSVGNEVTETASKKGIDLCAEMRDILHSLDNTRPVTCGINVLLDVYVKHGFGVYKDKGNYKKEPLPENKGYKEKKSGSAFFNAMAQKLGGLMFFMSKGKGAEKIVSAISPSLDIVGLNYASSRYDKDAKKYPQRLMLGTETMVKDLPYNWECVKKYPQLLGDFVWSAWDYLGEACIGDWTYYSYKGLPLFAGQGMVDNTGFPQAQMGYMQVVWGLRKEPYIAVRPINHNGETPKKSAWQFTNSIASWSWHGYEGQRALIEVYSVGNAVRLELNGKTIGTKKLKDYRAEFKTKYHSGTLVAVALDNYGKEISRSQLISGDKNVIINVKCSRDTLRANGKDFCFIEIEFMDKNGILKPYIEQEVEVKVIGTAARFMGMSSGLCKTNESLLASTRNSYRGRVLAAIQSTDMAGKVDIIVSSKGCVSVSRTVEVQ